MRRTVPPSAEIQQRIDELLAGGLPPSDAEVVLSELARLGAQLIIQRAVEDELDAFLGRERYERRADALPGKRNGYRPRHLQTAEGELTVLPSASASSTPALDASVPRDYSQRGLWALGERVGSAAGRRRQANRSRPKERPDGYSTQASAPRHSRSRG